MKRRGGLRELLKNILFTDAVVILIGLLVFGILRISRIGYDLTEIDSAAYEFVEEQEQIKVADVIDAMAYIKDSRVAATEQSIQESVRRSIEESVSESISEYIRVSEIESMEESQQQSIAESIQQSVEASIAESVQASIAESIAAREASIAAMEAAAEAALAEGKLCEGMVVKAGTDVIPLIRKLYSNTVVIGDSRAKGIVDNGVLTDNEVAYYGGASVGTLYDTTKRAAGLMRAKTLFIVGLNDLGYYGGDAAVFKADFINLIKTYLSVNPQSSIYLQEILPVQEYGRFAWRRMDSIPEFNNAIREICDEYGYTYVSATQYCLSKYVNSSDGAHFNFNFYILWAQTIANQMGLWGSLN
ncbi:MAG: hypothetical protein NC223_01115 [Butyrivibrio sp.]|nr:hypothetical protein [Butyrivibrio sp.]